MKTTLCATCIAAALILSGVRTLRAGGGRSAGAYESPYESLNAAGAAYATNGDIKLGGSLGQNGFIVVATNSSGDTALNGFWKADSACTMYTPSITNISRGTGCYIRISFVVVNSNRYSLLYTTEAEGGLSAAAGNFTNIVGASFVGRGAMGSATSLWDCVTSATNRARYYQVRCR